MCEPLIVALQPQAQFSSQNGTGWKGPLGII